jgi:hypothetical protein
MISPADAPRLGDADASSKRQEITSFCQHTSMMIRMSSAVLNGRFSGVMAMHGGPSQTFDRSSN